MGSSRQARNPATNARDEQNAYLNAESSRGGDLLIKPSGP
jgi:hypothetical protein